MALQGRMDHVVTCWGICCSSWVHINAGTSHRDVLTPMGCQAFESVKRANLIVSRAFPNSVLTVSGFNSFKIVLNGIKAFVFENTCL